jgi:uncharacterized protein (DUF927 family)
MEIQNPIFDICGLNSRGKTTAFIRLAGSVWGWSDSETGFADSWHTTTAGLDVLLASHNDGFLGLDEANLAHEDPKQRAKIIHHGVHIIANGREKTTKPGGVPMRSTATCCVSTSNDPLLDYVIASEEAKGALAARMVTILIPETRRYGVLKRLPKGYINPGKAIDAINAATAQHHGAPIRSFLKRLVRERSEDKEKLIQTIRKYFDMFLKAVGIDGRDALAYRRAKSFALA